ncbi:MAG TPA: extracellular solute-binding protein, partial [Kofleriaceae bacterium]|nr:extracellular solute-binding protein [Kofleriaceae bacterium]
MQRLTAILACACAVACGDPPAPAAIRFLHTFSPAETELFNAVIAERGLTVESSLVPFARGQQVIGEILATGQRCPDLIRIDATWLPGLRAQLVPVPGELASLDWTPEAAALGQQDGAWWGVPQTVDGLLVVRDAALPAPASPSIDDVVAAARAARTPARPHRLGVRVDAYWFVPWLRAEGGDLAPDALGAPHAVRDGATAAGGATRALATFAALFGEVAAPPPAAGSEAPEELRRFRAGEVAYWITGPWQFGELGDASRIAVSPLAGAPRGGQLLVVPTCAARPEQGWRLAAELASVPVATRLAQAFSTIPTRT